MPANISVCRNGECRVYGYSVTIQAGANAGEIDVNLIDTCSTLNDFCRTKTILVRALVDWLSNEGESTEGLMPCRDTYCVSQTNTGLACFSAENKITYTNPSGVVPASSQTVNVPLPMTCDNIFA